MTIINGHFMIISSKFAKHACSLKLPQGSYSPQVQCTPIWKALYADKNSWLIYQFISNETTRYVNCHLFRLRLYVLKWRKSFLLDLIKTYNFWKNLPTQFYGPTQLFDKVAWPLDILLGQAIGCTVDQMSSGHANTLGHQSYNQMIPTFKLWKSWDFSLDQSN